MSVGSIPGVDNKLLRATERHSDPGAHPTSWSVNTGAVSLEVKRPRLETNNLPQSGLENVAIHLL
jgi:hypothetical protein